MVWGQRARHAAGALLWCALLAGCVSSDVRGTKVVPEPTGPQINLSTYVTPPRIVVVSSSDVVGVPDGTINCLLTVPGEDVTARVDCAVSSPSYQAPPDNPGCADWGTTVRLTSRASFICSAPLPPPGELKVTAPATVRNGEIICIVAEHSVSCQHEQTGAGFVLSQADARVLPGEDQQS